MGEAQYMDMAEMAKMSLVEIIFNDSMLVHGVLIGVIFLWRKKIFGCLF